MSVYVASSWRNERQPEVVAALRGAGLVPYDFRNPRPGDHGFSWRDVGGPAPDERTGPLPKGTDLVPPDQYLEMVNHPVATAGFEADFAAMRSARAGVLVLPCGKSAHLELGWFAGAGVPCAVLLEDPVEPELMYRMCDLLTPSLGEIISWLHLEVGRQADDVARAEMLADVDAAGEAD